MDEKPESIPTEAELEERRQEERRRLERREEDRRLEDSKLGGGASLLNRILARAIDTLVFGFLFSVFFPIGVFAGFLYVVTADGFMGGRSLGKRITGIRVVHESRGGAAGFRESILRNLPAALVLFFAAIPIFWILFFTLGLIVLALETFMMVRDRRGQRVGDILARTVVVTADQFDQPVSEPGKRGSTTGRQRADNPK